MTSFSYNSQDNVQILHDGWLFVIKKKKNIDRDFGISLVYTDNDKHKNRWPLGLTIYLQFSSWKKNKKTLQE